MGIYSFDRRFRELERDYYHHPAEEALRPYNVARSRAGMEILETCPECGNIDEETHHYHDEERTSLGLGCEECDTNSCGVCGLVFGDSYEEAGMTNDCSRCGVLMCEYCQEEDSWGEPVCQSCLHPNGY